MALTQFGVVYSTGNAVIRRYVYPSVSDNELNNPGLVMPGEAIVKVSRGPYPNAAAWQAAVNSAVTTAAGKAPGNPVCCMVDQTNTVVGQIMADPAIDSVAGMTLVAAYATIPMGSTYDPISGLFTSPQVTIPINVAKGVLSVTVIPPAVIPKP